MGPLFFLGAAPGRRVCLFVGAAAGVARLLVACGDGATELAGGGGADASGDDVALADSSASPAGDGAVEGGGATADPWNPPLGAAVVGVTTHDGWETPRRLPAPVNVDGGWVDSVMITADARRLLFGYATYDFEAIAAGRFEISGARRPGQTADGFRIFQADLLPGRWEVTPHPINSADPKNWEASATLNAAQDLLVFSRWVEGTAFKADLFFASKTPGGWTAPAPVPGVNTACNDDNAFVVGSLASGGTLFFESDRVDLAGVTCGSKKHLFQATFAPDGGVSAVTRVPGLNGAGPDDEDSQPYVSPDGTTAYWTAVRLSPPFYGIYTATRAGTADPFGAPRAVLEITTFAPPFAGKTVLLGEANVATVAEGTVMVVMCGTATKDLDGGSPGGRKLDVCFTRRPK